MAKAVILARVSAVKQEKEGLSLKEIHFTLRIVGQNTQFVAGPISIVSRNSC